MAHDAHPNDLPTHHAAWYAKSETTFSDAIGAVHRQLWANCASRNSPSPPGTPLLASAPAQLLDFLVEAAGYAA